MILIDRECIFQFIISDSRTAEFRQVGTYSQTQFKIAGQTSDIRSFEQTKRKLTQGFLTFGDFKLFDLHFT